MRTTSGPSPMVSVETQPPPEVDVVDAHQRRAAVGQAEQALEAEGQVEVAARVEPALPEGVDARQLAFAQSSQVCASVPTTTSGSRRVAPCADTCPVRRARTSQCARVAQTHVIGGVEARVRPR